MRAVSGTPQDWGRILGEAVQGIDKVSGELRLGAIIKKVTTDAPLLTSGKTEYELAKILAKKLNDINSTDTIEKICYAFKQWKGFQTADHETRVAIQLAEQRLTPEGHHLPEFLIRVKERINTMILAASAGREKTRASEQELLIRFPILDVPKLLEEWGKLPMFSREKEDKRDEILLRFAQKTPLKQTEITDLRKEIEQFIDQPVAIPPALSFKSFLEAIRSRTYGLLIFPPLPVMAGLPEGKKSNIQDYIISTLEAWQECKGNIKLQNEKRTQLLNFLQGLNTISPDGKENPNAKKKLERLTSDIKAYIDKI